MVSPSMHHLEEGWCREGDTKMPPVLRLWEMDMNAAVVVGTEGMVRHIILSRLRKNYIKIIVFLIFDIILIFTYINKNKLIIIKLIYKIIVLFYLFIIFLVYIK